MSETLAPPMTPARASKANSSDMARSSTTLRLRQQHPALAILQIGRMDPFDMHQMSRQSHNKPLCEGFPQCPSSAAINWSPLVDSTPAGAQHPRRCGRDDSQRHAIDG